MTATAPNEGSTGASMTPGPWVLDRCGEERMVVSTGAKDAEGCPVLVCDLYRGGYDYSDLGYSLDANARAIAACPDLIEALREAKDRLGGASKEIARLRQAANLDPCETNGIAASLKIIDAALRKAGHE